MSDLDDMSDIPWNPQSPIQWDDDDNHRDDQNPRPSKDHDMTPNGHHDDDDEDNHHHPPQPPEAPVPGVQDSIMDDHMHDPPYEDEPYAPAPHYPPAPPPPAAPVPKRNMVPHQPPAPHYGPSGAPQLRGPGQRPKDWPDPPCQPVAPHVSRPRSGRSPSISQPPMQVETTPARRRAPPREPSLSPSLRTPQTPPQQTTRSLTPTGQKRKEESTPPAQSRRRLTTPTGQKRIADDGDGLPLPKHVLDRLLGKDRKDRPSDTGARGSNDPPALPIDDEVLQTPTDTTQDSQKTVPYPEEQPTRSTDDTKSTIEYPEGDALLTRTLTTKQDEEDLISYVSKCRLENDCDETMREMYTELRDEFSTITGEATVGYWYDVNTHEVFRVDDSTSTLTEQELIQYSQAVHDADFKELHQFVHIPFRIHK